MRILFLSHYFPPEGNAPATRTVEHCARWVQAGHDVTVITCVPNCPDGVVYDGYRSRWRTQTEVVQGIKVVRVWTYLAPNAGTTRRIASYVSYMLSATLASLRLPRPDVVVATSPQFFCGWAGVLTSWLKWTPLVLEIRDIWPESIQAVGAIRNRTVLWILEQLERWMYQSARHIVTVGDGYRQKIAEKVALDGRISVITNGVDPRQFVPRDPDPALLRKWNSEGQFVCAYIGTIGMAHALEVVLNAARMLKENGRRDIKFWLVGDGASRRQLEAHAAQLGIGDLVVFAGRQPKESIPAILASCQACLIHLKKCELFTTVIPSKVFECMAMARPIIMGVDGQARRIVMQAGAGLEMEPESPEALVDLLEILADNPQLAIQLGQAGRDYVTEHFRRDALAWRYLQLLQETAGVAPTETAPQEPGPAASCAEHPEGAQVLAEDRAR